MTIVRQAAVFRLYPNAAQESTLRQWTGAARYVWNQFVAHNQTRYEAEKKFDFHAQLSALLPQWKLDPERQWLGDPPAISLVDVSRRYDAALSKALKDRKKPGRKAGFPTFHAKREGYGSLYLTGQGLKLERQDGAKARGWLVLPKGAGRIRMHGGQWPDGKIASARIKQQAGVWSVAIQFDGAARAAPAPAVDRMGIDLGLDALVALDDGTKIEAPRLYRQAASELGRLQRRFGRQETREKQAGRHNKDRSRRQKGRLQRIQALHRKVAARRRDFTHQVSNELTAKARVIAMERLGVGSLARTRLAKSIHDAAWGELIRQIEYKAAWRGRVVLKMGRFERSTGCCPDCGEAGQKLALSERRWVCGNCGAAHDRDTAAARWIGLYAQAAEVPADAGTGRPLQRGLGLRRKAPGRTANVETNTPASAKC